MKLQALIARIKGEFDNYRLSTLFSLPVAIILMAVAMGVAAHFGVEDLIKASSIVVDFVIIPAFVARLVSASSYLGRLLDAWNADMRRQANKGYVLIEEGKEGRPVVTTSFSYGVKTDRIIANWERWMTSFGVLLGIAIGVMASLALGAAIPLAPSLSVLAYPIYVAGFIGIIGGVFNRIGLIIDNRVWLKKGGKGNRNKTEVGLMLGGGILGLGLGLALVLSSSTSLAVIAGVTPFLAIGVFPPSFGGIVFVLITMSVFTSAADYVGKSVSYLRSFVDKEFSQRLIAKQVMHEHRGSFVGVLVGVGVGVAVTLALALTTSSITGLAGFVIASLVISTTTGVVGGLVARVARLVDRLETPPTSPLSPSSAKGEVKEKVQSEKTNGRGSSSPRMFSNPSPASEGTPSSGEAALKAGAAP